MDRRKKDRGDLKIEGAEAMRRNRIEEIDRDLDRREDTGITEEKNMKR